MTKPTPKRPILYARVSEETMRQAQEAADRLYDGNISLLMRMALKQFIERQEAAEREGQAVA